MRPYSLSHLSDGRLLHGLKSLVARDRTVTAALLAHVAEVDARKLYLPAAHPSMFSYCVNERYLHRRPMLFTTNKPLAAWGLVLHDPDLAEAILDRVLERGRLVELRGASYRTRHLKSAGANHRTTPTEAARRSGNQVPEYPEPTCRHRCSRLFGPWHTGCPRSRPKLDTPSPK